MERATSQTISEKKRHRKKRWPKKFRTVQYKWRPKNVKSQFTVTCSGNFLFYEKETATQQLRIAEFCFNIFVVSASLDDFVVCIGAPAAFLIFHIHRAKYTVIYWVSGLLCFGVFFLYFFRYSSSSLISFFLQRSFCGCCCCCRSDRSFFIYLQIWQPQFVCVCVRVSSKEFWMLAVIWSESIFFFSLGWWMLRDDHRKTRK